MFYNLQNLKKNSIKFKYDVKNINFNKNKMWYW